MLRLWRRYGEIRGISITTSCPNLLLPLHGLHTFVLSTAVRERWIPVTADYTSGKWCQSPRVKLVVSNDTSSSEGSFLFPQELLGRRSRTLQERIELHNGIAISLSDTAVQTLTEFFIWSHRPDPHLEDRLSFTEVVDLGIFAWKYQISALSNQVTDKMRANLASGEWQLQATIVDAIYQATETDSPLRGVVRAALGQLSRTVIAGEEWEKTFRNNRDLGWDYLRAGDKEWVRQDYLSGVCRFHNHDGIKRQEGLCDGCPFAEADCYPDWEENTKQEQKFDKSEHETASPLDDAAVVVLEEAAVEEPEPCVAEPEPEPEQCEAEPEPAVEEVEPAFTEAEPAVEEVEPAFAEAEPAFAEAEPAFEEAEPAFAEAEPAFAEAEPAFAEAEPAFAEAEPAFAEAEPAFEEAAAEDAAYEEAAVEELSVEEAPLEPPQPEKVNGNLANGLDMNGHVESEDAEEAHEEADGSETPHVNGARPGSVAESLYPDSMSSDRENLVAIPPVNGNMAEKSSVKATVTAVPEAGNRKLSKNQKKKMAKRLSMSMGRGIGGEGLGEKKHGSVGVSSGS